MHAASCLVMRRSGLQAGMPSLNEVHARVLNCAFACAFGCWCAHIIFVPRDSAYRILLIKKNKNRNDRSCMLEPLCDPLKTGTGVSEDRSCMQTTNHYIFGIAHIYTAQSRKCEQGHTKQVHLSKRVSKDRTSFSCTIYA